MSSLVDGRAIAQAITTRLGREISSMDSAPRLGIVVVGGDSVTQSYLAIKERTARALGVDCTMMALEETATTSGVIKAMTVLAQRVDGLIVQLPLPPGLNQERILQAIPLLEDVDALHPDQKRVLSPVVLSVLEILAVHQIDLTGKHIVIIGRGNLVGRPLIHTFRSRGLAPLVIDRQTPREERKRLLRLADLIISGVGEPGVVKPEDISQGVILIDAGTSSSQQAVVGDIHPECYKKASLFSPTPGGLGPITVAKLFENLVFLTKLK